MSLVEFATSKFLTSARLLVHNRAYIFGWVST